MATDRHLYGLALAQLLVWAGFFYLFPALLVTWESDTGWSRTQLTGALTLAILVSGILSPLAGKIIDLGYGMQLMSCACLIGSGLLVGLALADSLWQFYILWILMGAVFAACLYDPCFSLLTRARKQHARRAITRVTLVAGFASTVSFPVVNVLANQIGWRGTLLVIAVFTLLVTMPLMVWSTRAFIVETGQSVIATEHQRATEKHFLHLPAFWVLAFSLSCLALLHGITLHHLLPLLNERGVSNAFSILIVSLIGPSQVAGRLLLLGFERKIGNLMVANLCFLSLLFSILILLLAGDMSVVLLGFVVLFGGGYGMVSIMRPVVTREILGETDFGTKSGALSLPYLAGSALAPWLGSVLWLLGGYALAFTAVLVVTTGGMLLFWRYLYRKPE